MFLKSDGKNTIDTLPF